MANLNEDFKKLQTALQDAWDAASLGNNCVEKALNSAPDNYKTTLNTIFQSAINFFTNCHSISFEFT